MFVTHMGHDTAFVIRYGAATRWGMLSTSSSEEVIIMIRKTAKGVSAVFAAVMLMPAVAMADVAYTDFGSLPGANFGGTGIPNDAVAATNVVVDGDNKITIALTAHQRYSNPVVTSDGAGTYFAQTGANDGLDGANPAHSTAATWNFGFYMNIEDIVAPNDSPDLGDYKFTLYYDFDPGADTGNAAMGHIDFPLTTQTNYQDSQNLVFGFRAKKGDRFIYGKNKSVPFYFWSHPLS